MLEINLAALPNQSFSVTIGTTTFELRIFLAVNVMCCDLSINGVAVLTSARLVAGSFLIPYRYLENGNFFITTLNDELPYYEQFGTTQFLIYLTQAELASYRNGRT